MMREDTRVFEATIDQLIREWHIWSNHSQGLGYPREIPTRRLHTISRQYESENGCLDLNQHDERMFAVQRCIFRLEDPYRNAIFLNARNLVTGVWVWMSPRLPADRDDRAVIVASAREKLLRLFQLEGIA